MPRAILSPEPEHLTSAFIQYRILPRNLQRLARQHRVYLLMIRARFSIPRRIMRIRGVRLSPCVGSSASVGIRLRLREIGDWVCLEITTTVGISMLLEYGMAQTVTRLRVRIPQKVVLTVTKTGSGVSRRLSPMPQTNLTLIIGDTVTPDLIHARKSQHGGASTPRFRIHPSTA